MIPGTNNTTDESTPPNLSLEFAWKAKSTYWAGEIKVIDVYIDGQLRYTLDIPKKNDSEPQAISLPFKKQITGLSTSSIDYLVTKNLDTAKKITLKAGIFNKKEGGDIMSQTMHGEWERNFRYTREDISLALDLSSLKLGNHYKIIATHSMEPTEPGSSCWQGENLHTLIEEDGPSKKNAPKPSRSRSTLFSHSSNSSETNHDSALPSELEFRRRKEHSDNQQEIVFFTLVLEKKYEKAIMHASNMDDQKLGGKLILDLLKYKQELAIDVDTMNNNPLKQTPLHRAAINRKWHAYYALVKREVDSELPDFNGRSAQDYRIENGMDVHAAPEELKQILRDLFGNDAAEAETIIDFAPNCRIC